MHRRQRTCSACALSLRLVALAQQRPPTLLSDSTPHLLFHHALLRPRERCLCAQRIFSLRIDRSREPVTLSYPS
jgi:hypothetical protein